MPKHMTRQLANFNREEFNKGRIKRETMNTFSTLVGDMITFQLEQGDFWQALHITQISIAPPHTFDTYEFMLRDRDGNTRELKPGVDYVTEDDGCYITFTNTINGPIDVVLRHRLPPQPRMRLLLLPWRMGHHQFSRECMEDLVKTCVGEVHPLHKYDVPQEFSMYKSAKVLEATLTENGIEAVVELGWEDVT